MAAGDPFIDLAYFRLLNPNAQTGSQFDATLTEDIALVSSMIADKIKQPVWSAPYTQYYDALPTNEITLRQWPVYATPYPVVHVAPLSNGDPALFTAATLLTPYVDYILKDDQPDGKSRCATLRRINQQWGWRYNLSLGLTTSRLTPNITPDWKAVQVTYTAGYDDVPPAIKNATFLVTAKLFQLRTRGITQPSEGLAGSSWSLSVQNAVKGLLEDDLIFDMLRPWSDIYTASPE